MKNLANTELKNKNYKDELLILELIIIILK